jgi:hypothetical protein
MSTTLQPTSMKKIEPYQQSSMAWPSPGPALPMKPSAAREGTYHQFITQCSAQHMMVCFLLCSDKSDTYMLSLKKSLIHAAAKPIVSSNKRGWAWLASLGYPDTTTATKSRHELPVHACHVGRACCRVAVHAEQASLPLRYRTRQARRASCLPRCRSRWRLNSHGYPNLLAHHWKHLPP